MDVIKRAWRLVVPVLPSVTLAAALTGQAAALADGYYWMPQQWANVAFAWWLAFIAISSVMKKHVESNTPAPVTLTKRASVTVNGVTVTFDGEKVTLSSKGEVGPQ